MICMKRLLALFLFTTLYLSAQGIEREFHLIETNTDDSSINWILSDDSQFELSIQSPSYSGKSTGYWKRESGHYIFNFSQNSIEDFYFVFTNFYHAGILRRTDTVNILGYNRVGIPVTKTNVLINNILCSINEDFPVDFESLSSFNQGTTGIPTFNSAQQYYFHTLESGYDFRKFFSINQNLSIEIDISLASFEDNNITWFNGGPSMLYLYNEVGQLTESRDIIDSNNQHVIRREVFNYDNFELIQRTVYIDGVITSQERFIQNEGVLQRSETIMNGFQSTSNYFFDPNGFCYRKDISTSSGRYNRTILYIPNSNNQLIKSIQLMSGRVFITEYIFDGERIQAIQSSPNGSVTTISYDSQGRINRASMDNQFRFDFIYLENEINSTDPFIPQVFSLE